MLAAFGFGILAGASLIVAPGGRRPGRGGPGVGLAATAGFLLAVLRGG